MDSQHLANLDHGRLAARLVAIAQEARRLVADGDLVRLSDRLEEVRRAADCAQGENLAMLEVSEAFLRAMASSDFNKSERALGRLFSDHPDLATSIFARLVEHKLIAEEELLTSAGIARGQMVDLIELGVLRRVGKAFDIRPSLRPLARDLLEPVALRMWRTVETARARVGLAAMHPAEAAAHLARQLGITTTQATVHLATQPLAPTRQETR